jgi:hypothetical protein
MSRTIKGTKPKGYDFWSARPGNKHGAGGFGKNAKKFTHRAERYLSNKICKCELQEIK